MDDMLQFLGKRLRHEGGEKEDVEEKVNEQREKCCAMRKYLISICGRCQNSSKVALGLRSAEYIETIFHRGDSFEAGGLFFFPPPPLFRTSRLSFHLGRRILWFSWPDVTHWCPVHSRRTNRGRERMCCILCM